MHVILCFEVQKLAPCLHLSTFMSLGMLTCLPDDVVQTTPSPLLTPQTTAIQPVRRVRIRVIKNRASRNYETSLWLVEINPFKT